LFRFIEAMAANAKYRERVPSAHFASTAHVIPAFGPDGQKSQSLSKKHGWPARGPELQAVEVAPAHIGE